MIKLNRTTEYGLIALRHMSRKKSQAKSLPKGQDADAVTSAREISDFYQLPFEITAKTLQRLKDTGIIQSAQGARGGYTLQKALSDVSLGEFLEVMEGQQCIVECTGSQGSHESKCEYHQKCEIKGMMNSLNQRLVKFLSGISLSQVTEGVTLVELTSFSKSQESTL